MDCNISYKDKDYSPEEFRQYIKDNPGEFGNVLLQKKDKLTIPSQADAGTLKKLRVFANTKGIQINNLSDLVINGERLGMASLDLGIHGLADVVNGKVWIREGSEAKTEPEEISHIAVEILKQKNNSLYKEMINTIGKYKVYEAVKETYGKEEFYKKEGKLDIIKLKEEAIGKLVAEHIILENQGVSENPELLAKVQGWWDKVKDFFKGLFKGSQYDPFRETAKEVLSNDLEGELTKGEGENHFFQLGAKGNSIFEKLQKENADTVRKEGRFERSGELIEPLIKERFKKEESKKDDFIKEVNNSGNRDIENILSRYIDNKGNLKEVPEDKSDVSNLTPGLDGAYNALEKTIAEKLNILKAKDPNVKFLHDVAIYSDREQKAGILPLIALHPEGKTEFYLWKFMDIRDTTKDLSYTVRDSIREELGIYKKTLRDTYGIKEFGETQVIPVQVKYRNEAGEYQLNDSIRIGNNNYKLEEEDKFLPVTAIDQPTGNKSLDKLVRKLNDLYKELQLKSVSEGRRDIKAQQLNNLYAAIHHLQVKGSMEPLFEQVQSILNYGNERIEANRELLKGDIADLTQEQVTEQLSKLNDLKHELGVYKDMDTLLDGYFGSEDKQSEDKIGLLSSQASKALTRLQDTVDNIVDRYMATPNGIIGILTPEPIVKNIWQKYLRPASKGVTASVELFAHLRINYSHIRDLEVKEMADGIHAISDKVKQWSSDQYKYVSLLRKKDTNLLIDQYSRKFYDTLKDKVAKGEVGWIKDNIDKEKFEQWAKNFRETKLKQIEETVYPGSEQEQTKRRTEERDRIVDLTNTNADYAWLQYRNIKQFPKEDWFSEDYKELKKQEPVLDLYNFIRTWNEKARESGYLENEETRTFLPFLKKSSLERYFGQDKNWNPFYGFADSLTISAIDLGYGHYNTLTGKIEDTLPKYFKHDFSKEKIDKKTGKPFQDYSDLSDDIIKNTAIFARKVIEYKLKSDLEQQMLSLLSLEENKKYLQTSRFGELIRDADPIPGNTDNSRILNDFIKNFIYDQAYIQADVSDIVSEKGAQKFNSFSKGLKSITGIDIGEIRSGDRISMMKTLDSLTRFTQMKVLGINIQTSLYRLLGTNIQGFISSGQYYTKGDLFSSEWRHAGMVMYKNSDPLHLQVLKTFWPIEGQMEHEINRLSNSKLTQGTVTELMMSMMRRAHDAIQYVHFDSMFRNTIVVDGKVYNAREYLRKTDPRYSLPEKERLLYEKNFDKKVQELLKTNGILNHISLDDKGKLKIEGIDMKDPSVAKWKELVRQTGRRLSGNISREDESRARMNMIARQMLMFKNWMPSQFELRFSELSYNAGTDAWEWGKVRTFGKMMGFNIFKSIGNITSAIKGTDKGIDILSQMYEKKEERYYNRRLGPGMEREDVKPFVTREQFYDLARNNLKSEMRELIAMTSMLGVFIAAKALAKEEEDRDTKGYWTYALRVLDRSKQELMLYYNPVSLSGILNGSIFPLIGTLTDFSKVVSNILQEGFGVVTGDEEAQKKAHPMKFIMRSFPFSRELLKDIATFSPDFAQDQDVKLTYESTESR